MRAALHHFVRGDGGIESPGKQARHAPGCVGRKSSRAGNFSRIHEQRWAGRNFDAASQFGIVEFHASVAARGAQLIHQILPNGNVDIDGALRERFVAAFGAHRKRFKFLAANFFPCRAPKRREIVLASARNHSRHGIKCHAEHALDARDRFLRRSAFAKFHEQAVAGPQNSLHRQALERALQRHVQLAQEKAAISALEPQLVVVNDDDQFRLFHRFPGGRSDALIIPAAPSDCFLLWTSEGAGLRRTRARALTTVGWPFVPRETNCSDRRPFLFEETFVSIRYPTFPPT